MTLSNDRVAQLEVGRELKFLSTSAVAGSVQALCVHHLICHSHSPAWWIAQVLSSKGELQFGECE